MSDGTKIEWAEASWNPIISRGLLPEGGRGWHCEVLTPGCEHCYAQALNKRLGTGRSYVKQSRGMVSIMLDEKILERPLHWKRPRRIFVCSMSDLFGDWVSDEMIDRVFDVMLESGRHTFQVLTKRQERMRDYCRSRGARFGFDPLPNAWLGVSVEDQRRADERIPVLLETAAAVRWVSAEPLLGPVDLLRIELRATSDEHYEEWLDALRGVTTLWDRAHRRGWGGVAPGKLDWVVAGGESGPGARTFNVEWARSIIAQCKAAGVACFVKQLGSHPYDYWSALGRTNEWRGIDLRDRKGGDMDEWPADLRVREYPC